MNNQPKQCLMKYCKKKTVYQVHGNYLHRGEILMTTKSFWIEQSTSKYEKQKYWGSESF